MDHRLVLRELLKWSKYQVICFGWWGDDGDDGDDDDDGHEYGYGEDRRHGVVDVPVLG